MSNKKKLVVIGAGPGGYVAAIRAAQKGMDVTVVEANHLGGICLNWGCIPTKALLRSAELMDLARHSSEFGINVKDISYDMDKIVERSRNVSKQLSTGISFLFKKNNIKLVDGYAKIAKNKVVEVFKDDKKISEIKADNIIIATGAKARVIDGFKPDGKFILTYKEAMIQKELPKKLLVVGSGAIGVEFASFYRSLGSEVTLVEVADRILLTEDEEIATMARKAYEGKGIKIHTSVKLEKSEIKKDNVEITMNIDGKSSKYQYDKMIMAVGVVGNTENIGIENTKIKVEKSAIITDQFMQTSEEGVYAIGDVTSPPFLAHKASHEAIIAVEHIAGKKKHPIKRENIPGCIYATPQIASVGLTEKKAKELGLKLKVGKFSASANGKAIALGESYGMIKVIFDEKTGELLGAHMIGHEVTEMIQGFVIAKQLEATEEDIMDTIFPHPTMSEMMHEATLNAYNMAIHI